MSLADSLTHITDLTLGLLRSRLQLVSMDFEDELRSAIGILLAGAAATALATFALLFGAFAVVALFWDEHRIAALIWASAAFAISAILIAFLIRRYLVQKRPFLAATLEELERDRERVGFGR